MSNTSETYRRGFLTILVVCVTVAFVVMMRRFLLPVLLAAIFSALLRPVYRVQLRWFRGRCKLAAVVTLIVVLLVVVLPFAAFIGVLVSQAIGVSNSAGPWIQQNLSSGDRLIELIQRLPFGDRLLPYRDQILARGAELVRIVGSFVVNRLSAVTRGTVSFIFNVVLMLYAMFFFLKDGPAILSAFTRYLPLSEADTTRVVGRFVSVSRATLTSTVVIGVIQGTLGGLGFAVAVISGGFFWGTLMTVFSMIPGVGIGLIWLPACVVLLATGKVVTGVLLAVYCGLGVGSIDNLLRPRLVGKETQMHDLLVLLSTLGGIMMFGPVGFILGPVLAALFVTLWDIQGPSARPAPPGAGA